MGRPLRAASCPGRSFSVSSLVSSRPSRTRVTGTLVPGARLATTPRSASGSPTGLPLTAMMTSSGWMPAALAGESSPLRSVTSTPPFPLSLKCAFMASVMGRVFMLMPR